MTATMLPSAVRVSREQRIRAIRRLLEAHHPVERTTTRGCHCGWFAPSYLTDGWAAYRAHLASVLAAGES